MTEKYKSILPIGRFTANVVAELDVWLANKYCAATCGKFHGTIKKFALRAIECDKLIKNPYARFRIRKAHTSPRNAMTFAEVAKLEALDDNQLAMVDPRLVEVRDRLLLSCYCGLRISDNSSLLKSELREEEEGLVIDKVTQKMNGVRVLLPLRKLFAGKGEMIVRKYLAKFPDIPTVFPPIPDQKINQRLKALAVMIGLPFNLTFHVARHTCATLLAERTGDVLLIKKILGHTDIKTSMVYIDNTYNGTLNRLNSVDW